MNFFTWLMLGLVAYASGFSIRHFHYKDNPPPAAKCLHFSLIFFVASTIVFALLNVYVMHKAQLDMLFVLVSSLVATGIFYYGLSANSNNNMQVPD